ncbi:MAG: hypothetical protein ACF788_01335 [Novipirellula sp. JB048]
MVVASPTPAQAAAGNYRKKHIRMHGLEIAIETPKGKRRHPAWPPMSCDYGDIKRTNGADGDPVDVFVGPVKESQFVVVIDQGNTDGGFDEHKVMLGFHSKEAAVAAYRKSYTPGWKVGPVTTMTIEQLKSWLKSGSQRKPIENQVSRYAFNPEKQTRDGLGRFGGKTSSSQISDRHDRSTHPNVASLVNDVVNENGNPDIQRIDFVELDKDMITRIKKETGIDVSDFRASLQGRYVKHILDAHGSEHRKGQLPVTKSDIEKLDTVIRHADEITLVDKSEQGNQAIRFKKRINGHILAITLVSGKRKRLNVRSVIKYPSSSGKRETYQTSPSTSETPIAMNNAAHAWLGSQRSLLTDAEKKANATERFAIAVADAFTEQFAARKPRNSPGQLGMFGDGFGGDTLRSSKTQTKMDFGGHRKKWDESKHPRASDGRFGTVAGNRSTPKTPKASTGTKTSTGADGLTPEERQKRRDFWAKRLEDQQKRRDPDGKSQEPVDIGVRGDGKAELTNDKAKPGDQPGLLDGEGKRKGTKKPVFGGDKTKQRNLIDGLDASAGQMDMFGGDGTPDDLVLGGDGNLGGEPKPVADTPREEAKAEIESEKSEYEFARDSKVGNAGEDLVGSARHKVNR